MTQGQVKVYMLPILRLTKASDSPGKDFLPVDHQVNGAKVKYWRDTGSITSSHPKALRYFPIVLNGDGSPWEPAFLWLMDKARSNPTKSSSLLPIAQALKDYKLFLDEFGLEWNDFSSIEKLLRPTYLYVTHLNGLVNQGEIRPSTASRRMSTVIGLYRFAQNDPRLRFKPANEPWGETKLQIRFLDTKGFKRAKEVVTTDLRIRVPNGEDALSDEIYDGGKLRPMSVEEQQALVSVLKTLNNTEFSLMHYLALLTGAREMTIMTMRVKDFLSSPSSIPSWPYKIRCGPGTGIDTKFDKVGVYLNVPKPLYQLLHVYCFSERAQKRRAKSRLSDSPTNYLFLTRQGNPYYECKDDRNAVHEEGKSLRRTSAQGQSLRGFIAKYVIPGVRDILPSFQYKFHDARATFGMNWIDQMMETENADNKTYHWAMEQLRKMMWHKSLATTEKYLEYRRHKKQIDSAQRGWASYLMEIIQETSKCNADSQNLDGHG